MTKEQILAEIERVNANKFLPDAVKSIKVKKLQAQLESATGAPAGKIHIVKPAAATAKAKPEPKKTFKLTELTSKEDRAWQKHFEYFLNEGETDNEADKHAWEEMQNEFPRLKNFDGIKPAKSGAKGGAKSGAKSQTQIKKEKAAARPTYKYKGKTIKELTKEDCDELRKDVKERRQKAAKAEKKSKSKPVIEKIAANVATAVKQAVKNVSAADIKDDPKGEISKMERIEKAAKTFLAEMRSILGEDYDKESIDGEFKELHDMIKDLKKKYK